MGFRPPKILVFLIAFVVFAFGHYFVNDAVYAAGSEVYVGSGSVESFGVNPLASGKIPEVLTATDGAKENVIIASLLVYQIKINGDSLMRIANRFGVKLDDLLSEKVNPKLALRNNPDLLYFGETINIPVYRAESAVAGTSLLPKMAMMTQEDLKAMRVRYESAMAANNKRIKELENDKFAMGAIIVMSLALVFLLVLRHIFNRGSEKEKEKEYVGIEILPEKTGKTNFENSSPVEILEALRTVRGRVLEIMNDLPLVYDESGKSPSTLKKIREFMDKRPYLRDIPVSQWEEAMRIMKMNPRSAEDS